jgi:Fic family protein
MIENQLEMKVVTNSAIIHYSAPSNWINYDLNAIARQLIDAKSAVLSLRSIPYQRSWVESLQQMELKREVAGTSRIEGAEFTDRELDDALKETAEQLLTRSQRQARAAVMTYRWIAKLPDDRPINAELIGEIHRRIVTGADDDHCPPGELRNQDQNVTFGVPRHRGAEGGEECKKVFLRLTEALRREFQSHDPLIQALAAHYHFAAMHPFLDGNGRTARALEALLLQRAGLRDTCFIAMSNYYYDEKTAYLTALSEVRSKNHDLTPFLLLGLKGIETQARRLLDEIQRQVSKELFRNLMYDLFNRLQTPRKRVIAQRQIEILKCLLETDWMELSELWKKVARLYSGLKSTRKAWTRDVNHLLRLKAIKYEKIAENRYRFAVRLEWPTEITETAFFESLKELPKSKTYNFLQ